MVEQRFVSLDVLNNGAVRADGIDGSEIQIESHLPQPERCTSRHDDDETARRGTFPSVRRVRTETDPRNAKSPVQIGRDESVRRAHWHDANGWGRDR
jgi:hypothetical protein